ncbi:MAG: uroporphyrinogen-III synthase [Cellvibrionaceae bacterium]
MKQSFSGLQIAIPESRQLDVLATLFEKRGAGVLRCPLVSIHDSPEVELIEQWLRGFIASPPDILVILTGEGIKRLTGFASRAGLESEWQQALSSVYKIARGPKPNRALKLLDLQANELAKEPTTDGMIKSLEIMDLSSKTMAVQLYGEDPNEKLQTYLQQRQVSYNTVAPYIYASDVETDRVEQLIRSLDNDELDIICFTSKAQYQRLEKVANNQKLLELLENGLKRTKIAAVGPVVADQLKDAGFDVAVMPEGKYFMKPMVSAIESMLDLSCE